jgi:hypothetical protein
VRSEELGVKTKGEDANPRLSLGHLWLVGMNDGWYDLGALITMSFETERERSSMLVWL